MPPSPPTSPGLPMPAASHRRCEQERRLEAFLSDTLSPSETDDYVQHLSECPHCQALADGRLNAQAWKSELLALARTDATDPAFGDLRPWETRLGRDLETETNAAAVLRDEEHFPSGSVGRVLADRFELRRIVGMGGCGTVFEAWDRVLRREVAVKVPRWTLFESPTVRRRFAGEARAAARLSHPNIVPVHEARIEEAGECFLVSEFIRGPSLEAWLDQQVLLRQDVPFRQAAQIVAALASAADLAHRTGVVHRDLKPSNVLLAPTSEGELPFVPRITDFGLARLSQEVTATSIEGSVVGSLPYMAPEQAAGAKEIGTACDIYALGVILYELLTGTLPLTAESIPGLLAAIASQPPESPRRRRPEIPADLEAVCLKCLEKRPADRYRSAGALAVDLRLFLAGEPVTARLPGRLEQLRRWVRRNPAATAILCTVGIAILTVVGVLADANQRQANLIADLQQTDQSLRQSDRQLTSANTQLATSNERLTGALRTAGQMRRQAETQQRKTQESLYVSEFRQAMKAREDHDLPLLARLLNKLDQPEFAPFRGIECDWLRTHLVRPHRELLKFPGAAYTLAFADDGRTLAAAGRDSIVKLVRYADGTPISEWETQQKEINGLAFVAEGQRLWTSGDDGSLVQWDVATQRELLRIEAHAPEQAHALLLVPDQNLLISTGTDGRILLWDPLTGERRGELIGNENAVYSTALHPDRRHLYSTTRDRIWKWDLGTQTLESSWPVKDRPISAFLTRDGRWLITSEESYRMFVRNAETGDVVAETALSDHIRRMIQLPDSQSVYAVDTQGTWLDVPLPVDASSAGAPLNLKVAGRHYEGRTHLVMLSPDSQDFLTATADGRIVSWPVSTLSPHVATDVTIEVADSMRFHMDDQSVLFTDRGRMLRFDLNSLRKSVVFDFAPRECSLFRVLPTGDLLSWETAGERNGWLVHRRAGDWQPIAEFPTGSTAALGLMEFDPRLNLIVTDQPLDSTPAWHFATLQPFQELAPLRLRRSSQHMGLSSSTGRVAMVDEHAVLVRDLTSRDVVWRRSLPESVTSLAVAPDGRWVATATDDRAIRIWDVRTGNLVSELAGHRFHISTMAFSADGRTLFSGEFGGADESQTLIWHVATGDLLGALFSGKNYNNLGLLLSRANDRLLIHHDYVGLRIVPLKPSDRAITSASE